MRHIIFFSTVLVLAGCAQQKVWVNPNAKQSQFYSDKLQCEQIANGSMPNIPQPVIVQNQYTPPSNYNTNCTANGININCNTTAYHSGTGVTLATAFQNSFAQSNYNLQVLAAEENRNTVFNDCMQARGYVLTDKQPNPQAQAQNSNVLLFRSRWKALGDEFKTACADPNYAAYFSKTTCYAQDLSLAMLADTSTASAAEKSDILLWDKYFNSLDKKERTIISELVEPESRRNKVLQAIADIKEKFETRILALYSGQITWGEYNKERMQYQQEDQAKFNEEFK